MARIFRCEELLFFRWLVSFDVKNCYFLGGSFLFGDYFFILKKTFYNTWKSHYAQHQVPIMIFNKKTSSITNSKNQPWNFLSFLSRIVVNKFLKKCMRNCSSFAIISNCYFGHVLWVIMTQCMRKWIYDSPLDKSNIDSTCLNRSKLHLNKYYTWLKIFQR